MSIQINGIDKPKNCFDCPCIDAEFEECAAKEHYLLPKDEYGAVLGEVPDWCPITEPQTCDDAVSRQAAIKTLEKGLPSEPLKSKYTEGITVGFGLAITWIEQLPAVQSQTEIIRCKECRHRIVNDHYGEKGYLKIKGYCELDTGDPFELGRDAGNDDWFCADAERREEHHEAE